MPKAEHSERKYWFILCVLLGFGLVVTVWWSLLADNYQREYRLVTQDRIKSYSEASLIVTDDPRYD